MQELSGGVAQFHILRLSQVLHFDGTVEIEAIRNQVVKNKKSGPKLGDNNVAHDTGNW